MANRWCLLLCCWLGVVLFASLISGRSLFIELFVRSGVSGHMCEEEGSQNGCKSQHIQVSAAFNYGRIVSLIALLPGGLMFDRYGGRFLAVMGAGLATFGMMLVTIPLYGAANRSDETTSFMLLVALLFADTGAMLNSFSFFSIFWHFPKMQTMIAALMIGTYNFAGLLPNLFEYIINLPGHNISILHLIVCDIAAMILAGILCFFFVPTQEEYHSKAKEALNISLPRSPQTCSMLNQLTQAHVVLRVHTIDHVLFCLSTAIACVFNTMYTCFLSDSAELRLESTKAVLALPRLYTIILAASGYTITPLFSVVADASKRSPKCLGVFLSLTCFICTATVQGASWLPQLVCMTCAALFQSLFGVLIISRSLTFCLPSQLGTVNSVIHTYILVVSMLLLAVSHAVIDAVPTENKPDIVFYTSALSTVGMSVASVRLLLKGVPSGPILTPGDEDKLAQAFGCRTLKQALRMMHMEDSGESRRQLLQGAWSEDRTDVEKLMTWLDTGDAEEMTKPLPLSKIQSTYLRKDAVPRSVCAPGLQVTAFQLERSSKCRTAPLLLAGLPLSTELDLDDLESLLALSNHPAVSPEATVEHVPDDPWHLRPADSAAPKRGFHLGVCSMNCEPDLDQEASSSPACCEPTSSGSSSKHTRESLIRRSHLSRPRRCAATEPLLSGFETPFAGDAVPSADAYMIERENLVKALNRRLLETVQVGDTAALLELYEREDPKMLWDAHRDLIDNVLLERESLDMCDQGLFHKTISKH